MICMVFKWKLIRIKTLVSEMRHNNCLISTEGLKKFEFELEKLFDLTFCLYTIESLSKELFLVRR